MNFIFIIPLFLAGIGVGFCFGGILDSLNVNKTKYEYGLVVFISGMVLSVLGGIFL